MSQEALDDFLDVGTGPIARYVEEGLLPLRSIWSKPKGTTE
jgi:hypothetical protein